MNFRRKYFLLALLLFVIEVFIAAFVKDRFLRPYGGDLLVVIFLYCLVRSFFRISVEKAIFGTLLFAFAVEALQYFDLLQRLGLGKNRLAAIVLGSQFEWLDILFYILGAGIVLLVEKGVKAYRKK